MKYLKGLLSTFIFTLVTINAQSQALENTHQFTMDDCISYALENNEDVKIAKLENEKDFAVMREILADGLPQIDVNVDLANNFNVPTSFIPAIFFDPNAGEDEFLPVQFQTQYNGVASATFTQLIFDGSYFIGLQAAKTFTQLTAKDYTLSKIDIIENVTKAYYTVLVSTERLELVRNNYNRLDSLLRETKLLFENGFAEKIDVNRSQVQFNNIEVELSNSERLLLLSYSLLKFQMSMPLDESLILLDDIEAIEFSYEDYLGSDFQLSDRVEISRVQVAQELAAIDVRYIKVQYLPKLEFYSTLGASSGTTIFNDMFRFNDNWFGFGVYGLRVSMPIFDGFRKSNQIQQRRIKIDQVNNRYRRLEKSIDYEIQETEFSLKTSIDRMEAQKENMGLAREVFDVAKMKYQQGIGSNLEVIDADASYKEAQTNYFNALFDALISKVDFEKAIGKLL